MRLRYAILPLLAYLATACKKGDSDNPANLTGKWAEQERVTQFAGSHYQVSMTADGKFTMQVNLFTDIVTNSPCQSRTDYISGNWYAQNGNKVVFSGRYTDSSYLVAVANSCNGDLNYAQTFSYLLQHRDTLILNPQLSDYESVMLVKQ